MWTYRVEILDRDRENIQDRLFDGESAQEEIGNADERR